MYKYELGQKVNFLYGRREEVIIIGRMYNQCYIFYIIISNQSFTKFKEKDVAIAFSKDYIDIEFVGNINDYYGKTYFYCVERELNPLS